MTPRPKKANRIMHYEGHLYHLKFVKNCKQCARAKKAREGK